MKYYFALLALLLLLVACDLPQGTCVRGSGQIISEARDVPTFHSVELQGSANIYIEQATQSLRIYAEDNIMKVLRTRVIDGVLVIDTDQCVKLQKPIDIYLSMEEVKALTLTGSGKMVAQNPILSDELKVSIIGSGEIDLPVRARYMSTSIIGSGEIHLNGTASDHEVTLSGSGDIRAMDLVANNAKVLLAGSGNIDVSAQDSLDIEIAGSGRVRYKGSPESVHQSISGTGTITNTD